MQHGTLPMYHGTLAVYHGTFSYGNILIIAQLKCRVSRNLTVTGNSLGLQSKYGTLGIIW